MFEDSTFESAHRIRTRSRAWSLAALALNTVVLAAMIVIPLLYPEALPQRLMNILITAPPPPPAAPPPVEQQPRAQAFHGRPELIGPSLVVPRKIPIGITKIAGPVAPVGQISMDNGSGSVVGASPFGNSPYKPPVVVREQPKGPIVISKGVADGMAISKVLPHYPPIAQAAHIQGTVVLQAIISKDGSIANLRVVSGPAMLQQAARDAVSQWRYRPYLLSGQPVDVETTINVVFNLGQ